MRSTTCIDCQQTFEVSNSRGVLPQRCTSCRRKFLAAVQRERAAAQRAAELPRDVRCQDCGRAVEWSGKGRPPMRCPDCLVAWTKVETKRRQDAWRAANPDHVRAQGRRNYHRNAERMRDAKLEQYYRLKYGLTRAERDQMLVEQGGVCLICKTDDWGKKGPCVDHCHNTTKIRGLLCGRCNTMIGLAKEDPVILAAAIEYLKRE